MRVCKLLSYFVSFHLFAALSRSAEHKKLVLQRSGVAVLLLVLHTYARANGGNRDVHFSEIISDDAAVGGDGGGGGGGVRGSGSGSGGASARARSPHTRAAVAIRNAATVQPGDVDHDVAVHLLKATLQTLARLLATGFGTSVSATDSNVKLLAPLPQGNNNNGGGGKKGRGGDNGDGDSAHALLGGGGGGGGGGASGWTFDGDATDGDVTEAGGNNSNNNGGGGDDDDLSTGTGALNQLADGVNRDVRDAAGEMHVIPLVTTVLRAWLEEPIVAAAACIVLARLCHRCAHLQTAMLRPLFNVTAPPPSSSSSSSASSSSSSSSRPAVPARYRRSGGTDAEATILDSVDDDGVDVGDIDIDIGSGGGGGGGVSRTRGRDVGDDGGGGDSVGDSLANAQFDAAGFAADAATGGVFYDGRGSGAAVLLAALRAHAETVLVAQAGMQALKVLAATSNGDLKLTLCLAGALRSCIDAVHLHVRRPGVVVPALAALMYLLREPRAVRIVLNGDSVGARCGVGSGGEGGLDTVLFAMKTHPLQAAVQEAGCRILVTLLSTSSTTNSTSTSAPAPAVVVATEAQRALAFRLATSAGKRHRTHRAVVRYSGVVRQDCIKYIKGML
jgi:hypothetical protein